MEINILKITYSSLTYSFVLMIKLDSQLRAFRINPEFVESYISFYQLFATLPASATLASS